MNIVAAEMVDGKKHSAESEETEEEEFVKYGAVDEFYNLDKEIGKWVVSGMSFVVWCTSAPANQKASTQTGYNLALIIVVLHCSIKFTLR